MNISQFKLELIGLIASTQDKRMLAEVGRLMNTAISDTPYELTDDQRNALTIAEEQFSAGEYLSEADADAQADKWLEE